MQSLILFVVVCGVALGSYETTHYNGPIALPPGYDKHGAPLPVEDTHEVKAEKSHHLGVLAHAGGAVHPAQPYPGDWTDHDDGKDYHSAQHAAPVHHVAPHHHAAPVHHAAPIHHVAPQHHAVPQHEGPKYHGPIALPPGYDKHGAPLPVEDTHEVAAAKSAHFAAHHDATSRNVLSGPYHYRHNSW